MLQPFCLELADFILQPHLLPKQSLQVGGLAAFDIQ